MSRLEKLIGLARLAVSKSRAEQVRDLVLALDGDMHACDIADGLAARGR